MGLKSGAISIGFYTAGPNGYKADWRDHTFVHEDGHYIQRIDLGAIETSFAMKDYFKFTDKTCTGDGNYGYTADVVYAGGVPPFTVTLDDVEQNTLHYEGLGEGLHTVIVEDATGETLTWEFLATAAEDIQADRGGLLLYPNPAYNLTRVAFTLDQTTPVRISLLNMLGQQERVFDIGERLPGRHELTFDVSDLQPGLYYIRIETDAIHTRKLIVE